jgi:hypothetical protein
MLSWEENLRESLPLLTDHADQGEQEKVLSCSLLCSIAHTARYGYAGTEAE